ncbi:DNA-binding SARP family transcriptional activator [Herbihabitans rhizosphaerae]|uniref:DNA-binding SARP family transcriptional activator n=1 Tax=Herbihabitans rhizosphaerae TaxID=1872711 RepID=A0A4Q7KK40_9PSEU|nr:AfsR/SARP family transcriptional regulator [Herbihabitans rhizosphaerae]RZS36576.1 DNA-binding SARP family transcriptional activator [Herbihabitans rhizosphaerae]
MDIDVLGPLAVRIDGVSVTPTAAKPRKVLAMLAVHADEVVPAPSLFEELWGDAPPRTATTTVQTYVLHLRNLITTALRGNADREYADAKQVLATRPGGYVLNTGGGTVDVREFDRLAAAGHRARELGDYEDAARSFTEALSTWRGKALVDVQVGALLEVEVHRLEEARLNVLDRRIDADLRLGRHHQLLGELSALVSRHRTHEGLYAHLMLAMYRSGRRGEAVEVYRKLRACLAHDLGLEPSPTLRRLHRSMLDADPRLHEYVTVEPPVGAAV